MSFFRNLRSSITRGRSSSRDTTPVRNSRPGSVISSLNSVSGKRRDSIESHTDSMLNRSDTFILDNPDVTPTHSNCSTLEKKSKKSKVLEKFSTFTKRKKSPPTDTAAFEHHPSDNATNTYYKWQADGCNSLDYDSQNDPFNFLYEQQSSLKTLSNAGNSSTAESLRSSSSTSNTFDSGTYRKGKVSSDLKRQLKLLKQSPQETRPPPKETTVNNVKEEDEEEQQQQEDDMADKYKTVTLNSFRKSFRDKFLQQQKDAAHNPAWFVEVDPNESNGIQQNPRESSKESRRDLLVFNNENYRPGSRSPIRELIDTSKEKRRDLFVYDKDNYRPGSRSTIRERRDTSKEKRRDLFGYDKDNYRSGSRSPIRELRHIPKEKHCIVDKDNYITDYKSPTIEPRESSKENRRDLFIFDNDNYRPGSRSPIRDLNNRKAMRSPTRSPVKRNDTFKVERLKQNNQMFKIKSEETTTPSIRIEFKNSITPHIPGRMVPVGVAKPMPSQLSYYQKIEPTMNTSYTIKSAGTTTTRLNNHSPIRTPSSKAHSPTRASLDKGTNYLGRYQTLVQIKNDKSRQASPINTRTSRLSTRIQLNEPSVGERRTNINSLSPTFGKRYNSSHLLSSSCKAHPSKQTYFGDVANATRVTQNPLSSSMNATSGLRTRSSGIPAYNYKYHTPSAFTTTTTATATTKTPSRITPAHSAINISHCGSNNLSHLKHQQQQSRIVVAGQRRSRSPIKIPWR